MRIIKQNDKNNNEIPPNHSKQRRLSKRYEFRSGKRYDINPKISYHTISLFTN